VEEPGKGKGKKGSTPEIVIPLRKPYGQLVLGLLLFGAGAAFFFHRSSTNDRGLVLNGILHFGPDGADVFYLVMGLLSAGMSVMAGLGILRFSQMNPFELVIGKKEVTFPAGRPTGMRSITAAVRDIVSIGVHPPAAPKSLVLQTRDNVHWIPGNWLPKDWSVLELRDVLVERLRQPEETRDARGG
jgi:hypothetical protein